MASKNKDLQLEDYIKQALEEIDTHSSIPGGIATLLDIPERKPLPEVPVLGKRSLLFDLIEFQPQTYAKYITYIRMGAFFNTAAEAVGISEKTVADWGTKGKKDFNNGEDTYYSRFYQDVRKAVAQCRIVREQAIALLDPKKWLSQGPGKIFGNQWVDNPKDEVDETAAIPFEEDKVLIRDQTAEDKLKTVVISMDKDTEESVLDELKKVLGKREDSEDASSKQETK